MSGIIVDLILLLFVVLFGIIGYFKGFFRELLSFLGFIGSVIVSIFANSYFANFLNSILGWGTSISNYIMGQIATISGTFNVDTGNTVEELHDIINNSGAGLAYKELLKQVVNHADFSQGALTVAKAVGDVVSGLVMMVISFAILFALIRIVVFILDKLLSRISRESAVGVVNKWFGLLLGAIKGVAFLAIILVVCYLLCMIPSVNDFISPYIQSSYVTKHIYEYLGNLVLGVSGIW